MPQCFLDVLGPRSTACPVIAPTVLHDVLHDRGLVRRPCVPAMDRIGVPMIVYTKLRINDDVGTSGPETNQTSKRSLSCPAIILSTPLRSSTLLSSAPPLSIPVSPRECPVKVVRPVASDKFEGPARRVTQASHQPGQPPGQQAKLPSQANWLSKPVRPATPGIILGTAPRPASTSQLCRPTEPSSFNNPTFKFNKRSI